MNPQTLSGSRCELVVSISHVVPASALQPLSTQRSLASRTECEDTTATPAGSPRRLLTSPCSKGEFNTCNVCQTAHSAGQRGNASSARSADRAVTAPRFQERAGTICSKRPLPVSMSSFLTLKGQDE